MQTKHKIGWSIASAAVAAGSQALNALNINPSFPWVWVTFIGILIFIGILYWGWYGAENRAKRLEYSRPSVVFSTLSPAVTILKPIMQQAFFTRLEFVNNNAFPVGENSTANDLAASVKVLDKEGRLIDSWDGRWANTNEPTTPNEVWAYNKIKLPANNQRAILDVGYRLKGRKEFNGWDNDHYIRPTQRVAINPGSYTLVLTLGASNMEQNEFFFSLNIPDLPQTEINGVEVSLITAETVLSD